MGAGNTSLGEAGQLPSSLVSGPLRLIRVGDHTPQLRYNRRRGQQPGIGERIIHIDLLLPNHALLRLPWVLGGIRLHIVPHKPGRLLRLGGIRVVDSSDNERVRGPTCCHVKQPPLLPQLFRYPRNGGAGRNAVVNKVDQFFLTKQRARFA